MDPKEILKELVDKLAKSSGLDSEKQNLLGAALNSIIEYAAYKSDPTGRLFLQKTVNRAIINSNVKIIEDALTIYNDKVKEELSKSKKIDDLFIEVQKYYLSPTFLAFIETLKQLPHFKKRKKKKKSKFYENESWWFRFCEYLDSRYEDWRHELMGRALFLEQVEQNSISYSTLWHIAHLPPHSWDDLIQYKSLAGEVWINGEYCYNYMPGTYSALSSIDFPVDNKRRLVLELIDSLDEDNLTTDSGVVILDENDENIFKFYGKEYLIKKDAEYEDPMFGDVSGTSLEGKIRMYGIKLTYIGDELLDLAAHIDPNPEAFDVLTFGLNNLKKDDGIDFILNK